VGPRAFVDAVVKRKISGLHRESNPRSPVHLSVLKAVVLKFLAQFNLFISMVPYWAWRKVIVCSMTSFIQKIGTHFSVTILYQKFRKTSRKVS
jgi:hypothetical protein